MTFGFFGFFGFSRRFRSAWDVLGGLGDGCFFVDFNRFLDVSAGEAVS